MNTKDIGDVSEAKVIAKLVGQGYSVSIPFGENDRYDLIVDDGDKLTTVQVKTGRFQEDGDIIKFSVKSVYQSGGEVVSHSYTEVDEFMVYCPDNDSIYRVPVDETPKDNMTLRINGNGYTHPRVNKAEEYEV